MHTVDQQNIRCIHWELIGIKSESKDQRTHNATNQRNDHQPQQYLTNSQSIKRSSNKTLRQYVILKNYATLLFTSPVKKKPKETEEYYQMMTMTNVRQIKDLKSDHQKLTERNPTSRPSRLKVTMTSSINQGCQYYCNLILQLSLQYRKYQKIYNLKKLHCYWFHLLQKIIQETSRHDHNLPLMQYKIFRFLAIRQSLPHHDLISRFLHWIIRRCTLDIPSSIPRHVLNLAWMNCHRMLRLLGIKTTATLHLQSLPLIRESAIKTNSIPNTAQKNKNQLTKNRKEIADCFRKQAKVAPTQMTEVVKNQTAMRNPCSKMRQNCTDHLYWECETKAPHFRISGQPQRRAQYAPDLQNSYIFFKK